MPSNRLFQCIVASLVLAASGPAFAAKLYKWVDENGNVSYSQQKPLGLEIDSIEIKAGGPSDADAKAALEELTERADELSKDRDFAAAVTQESKDRNERIKQNCEVARENKRILESAPRVQDKDADGNPYFVDDSTRAARIATAEEQVRQFCK